MMKQQWLSGRLVLAGFAVFVLLGMCQVPGISTAGTVPVSHNVLDAAEGNGLASNSIIDLEVFGDWIWIASGGGLSRFSPVDSTWLKRTVEDGIGDGGVSGLAVGITSLGDTLLCISTAIDTTISGKNYTAGGGIGFSFDLGESWNWMPQPVDDEEPADSLNIDAPTTVSVQNITYDIALVRDRVWIASFAGGLRYYDLNEPEIGWVNQPPDTNGFDVLEHLNHRGFSVASSVSDDDTLVWCGTAGGINVSYDFGETWQRFKHSPTDENTLSGNFITAIGVQNLVTRNRPLIWAASWAAEGSSEFYGVCYSEDNGITWRRVLGSAEEPVRANNFAFKDSVVYVATDDGLYKSADFGLTWGLFPNIHDTQSGETAFEDQLFSVANGFDRLWAGGPEGLAYTENEGINWRLLRTFPIPGSSGTPSTYAYPNPFSPDRFEVVRFQYSLDSGSYVTVEVFDFAMELVYRPVNHKWRNAGDRSETWDGSGPGGRDIANGVYFYRIKTNNDELWGKVLLLD